MSRRSSAAEIVERIGTGSGQWKALVAGGGVWMADGAEVLLITSITQAVDDEWQLRPWERGAIVSIVFFGVLLGNLMSGVAGDLLGRKWPLIGSYFGLLVFSLLSVLSTGPIVLCCTRLFVGISFGLGQPAFNSFINEITPSKGRMTVNSWGQLLFGAGELYACALIWFQDPYMTNLNWRWLIALGAIPSAVFLVLSAFMLPESPSFLAVNGRHEEAREVLRNLRDSNGALDVDIDLDDGSLDANRRSDPGRRHSPKLMDKIGIVVGRYMLYTTLTMCITTFTINFLFYGGLYSFPQILPDMKLSVSPSLNLMLGSIIEFPGYLIGVFIGAMVSRKTMLTFVMLMSAVWVLVFNFASLLPSPIQVEVFTQIAFAGHKMFIAMGFVIAYVYTSEVYPTVARTTGGALCLAAGRIGAMAAPSLYESLVILTGGYTGFFCFTATLCTINAVLVLFLPFETKDAVLQDYVHQEQQPIASIVNTNTDEIKNV